MLTDAFRYYQNRHEGNAVVIEATGIVISISDAEVEDDAKDESAD